MAVGGRPCPRCGAPMPVPRGVGEKPPSWAVYAAPASWAVPPDSFGGPRPEGFGYVGEVVHHPGSLPGVRPDDSEPVVFGVPHRAEALKRPLSFCWADQEVLLRAAGFASSAGAMQRLAVIVEGTYHGEPCRSFFPVVELRPHDLDGSTGGEALVSSTLHYTARHLYAGSVPPVVDALSPEDGIGVDLGPVLARAERARELVPLVQELVELTTQLVRDAGALVLELRARKLEAGQAALRQVGSARYPDPMEGVR